MRATPVRTARAVAMLLVLGFLSPLASADEPVGLAAVAELGAVNGIALACRENAVAAQARKLMLDHAPKTDRYGSAYQQATQAAFLKAGAGECPEPAVLADHLAVAATKIRNALPKTASPGAQ